MKRCSFLLTVIFMFLCAFPIHAAQRYVGLVGGLNFADLSTKLSSGAKLETNLHVCPGGGAVFGFELRENVFLQLEPKYLQKGGKLLFEEPEETPVGEDWSPYLDFRFSFIEISALARIKFGDQIKRYAFFGPSFGFLLNAEVDAEFNGLAYTADSKEVTKKTDFGLLLGTGVSLPLGRGDFFLDGRYAFGFANLNKGGTVEFKHGDDPPRVIPLREARDKISTTGFQIMAGYLIPLGE